MEHPALSALRDLLKASPQLKYQITIQDWQTDFLRFYQSQTNYNISKDNLLFNVTLYDGKKSFSFGLDNPTPKQILQAYQNAVSLLPRLPEDPDFVDVESDQSSKPIRQKPNNISILTLQRKIDLLHTLSAAAEPLGFDLFGTFICNSSQLRIINSNGIDKHMQNNPIYFEVKAVNRNNQVTVLQVFGGEDVRLFDERGFQEELIAKMHYALGDITDIEPGEYEVILAPRCIAEYMMYLSGSMTARSIDQKNSWFEGKRHQQVFPAAISIWDNPEDPQLITYDYNSEGHIYNKLPLVEHGIFRNFMCNNYYSHKTGLPNNGNVGACLVLEPGDKSLQALIGSVKYGLYISSLHYMNFINMKETSVTGLTRDGTFLIENGKITKVVNSLRFTEKLNRIFEHIVALENRSYTIPFSENYEFFDIESAKAPHVLVRDFNITSSTHTI